MTSVLDNLKSICRVGVGAYNEDACGNLKNAVWVIDGATGLNGKNLVSDTSDAHWYSSWWNKYIRGNLNDDIALSDFLDIGIRRIKQDYIDKLSKLGIELSSISKIDLPSASICLVRVIGNKMDYIILGDCRLYIRQFQETIKISDESVSLLDDQVFDMMRTLDGFGQMSLEETRAKVMDKIIENRLKNNTDQGYWILSFDEVAAHKAKTGVVDLAQDAQVMIASDGYFSVADKYHMYEEMDLFEHTLNRGMDTIYEELRTFESDEERVAKIPRFKSMDDATCATFSLKRMGGKRVLHISAQKPDYTGSGVYMSGVIKGMGKLTSKQALIAGVDVNDDLESMMAKFQGLDIDFYPVVYNRGQLDFNVPGMSDNMPYPSTVYRQMTASMADKMEEAFLNNLDRAVGEFRPDLIVCHHLYFTTSLVRRNIRDIPVVAICHGTCLRQLMSHDFKKDLIMEEIPRLDKIFALHQGQADLIEKVFGIGDEGIEVLGSGYDKAVFNSESRDMEEMISGREVISNKDITGSREKIYNNDSMHKKEYLAKKDDIILSYAGKLAYAKGLMEFFDALDQLDFPEDKLVLYLAGDGSDQEEVLNIKKKAKLSKYRIEFLGRLNQNQLASMLNQSDIFVLPSYYEGLPLVLLEAMACGNLVLTTDIEGVRSWLGEEINSSGIISYVDLPEMEGVSQPRMDNIGEYVDRLTMAISDSIKTKLDGNYRKVNIESMSWDGLAERLYKSCENMCSDKFIVVDRRMKKDMRDDLLREGYILVDSYDHDNLYPAIRSHVDIGLFKVGDYIVASKDSYDYYASTVGPGLARTRLVCGDSRLGPRYPDDIAYNFSFSGRYGIGKLDHIDPVIRGLFEEKYGTVDLINVKQGYSACSILWVDEKSLITSDMGIIESLKDYDIDILKISEGSIELFDMEHGFIGGATGRLEDGTIVFFGDVFTHPDGQKIIDFIDKKGKIYRCLGKGNLQDYGGMLVI